jgi:NAD(P)-dependent dehydrogenase (short-subunit alcohol dehydrogenase family)
MVQIADKVFVVTGGGNGMGREVVLGLIRRGARVAAIDLDERGLAETRRLCPSRATVSTHVVDVTDRAAGAALPAQILDAHGQIDGVVNIAGIIHRFVPFIELSDDEIDRIMAVNFSGTLNMCRVFLPILLKRPEANLTNMSSLAALLPFASQALYGAS